MATQRKPRKLVPLAAALSVLVAAAVGGYALAGSRAAEEVNLASASGASGRDVTVAACLASGRLTRVSVAAAPKCPAKSARIRWAAQSGPAGASGRDVTVAACLASGRLTRVSVAAAPKCPAKSARIHWAAQSGSASPPSPMPSASSSPMPSASSSPMPSASSSPSPSASSSPSPSGNSLTPPPSGKLWSTTGNTNLGPFNYPPITASSVFGGGNTWVRPNEWNIGSLPSTQQTTYAYNPGDWQVVANIPAGNTAVITGPDTQQDMYNSHQVDPAVSGFTEITSTYSVTMPQSSSIDAEANYDIWLNHWGTEVMIWTDTEKQRPAGSEGGTYTIGGSTYNFWSRSGTKNDYPRGPFSFVLTENQPSGSVDILAVLQWLINNKYIPASSGLTDVEFGFELCSTGGVPQAFSVNNYTLTTSPNPSA
jgi:hypothetical protein